MGWDKVQETYLFDSSGRHIANFIDHQLYAPTGKNVGHYLQDQQIFIDMGGRYLGEIVSDNRLLQMVNSPHRSTNFGRYGSYGSAGNYGNPGRYGGIGMLAGYKDIVADWMS